MNRNWTQKSINKKINKIGEAKGIRDITVFSLCTVLHVLFLNQAILFNYSILFLQFFKTFLNVPVYFNKSQGKFPYC